MGLKLLAEGSSSGHLLSSFQRKDAELGCERDQFSSADANHRMPAGGDPLEGLKKTMLYHEQIFQCQVADFHRLYWTQKNLMNGLSCNEFGNYAAACSRKPLPMPENASSLNYMRGRNVDISEQFMDFSSALSQDQQRSFNLQLSADEYIKHADDGNRHADGSIRNNILVNPEALDLNLGIKDNNSKGERRIGKIFADKEDYLYSHEVIDLEDSVESGENEEGTIVSSFDLETPALQNEVRYNSKLPRLFDINSTEKATKDLGFTNSADPACTGQSEVSSIRSGNVLISKQLWSPPRRALFDLNTVQPEEPSSGLAGPLASLCGLAGELSVFKGAGSEVRGADLLINVCEVSHTRSRSDFGQSSKGVGSTWNHGVDDGNVESMRSDFNAVLELNRLPTEDFSDGFVEGTEQSSNGSSPLPPSNLYSLNNKDTDLTSVQPVSAGRNASSTVDLKGSTCLPSLESTNLVCKLDRDAEVKQAEGERSEEDTVSSSMYGKKQVQADILRFNAEEPVQLDQSAVRNKFNNLCCFGCQDLQDINEDNQIMEMGLQVAGTCSNPKIKIPGHVVCQEEQICSHKKLQNHDEIVVKQKVAAYMDPMALMAAESLLLISLENLTVCPLGSTEVMTEMDLETKKMNELPEYSSDSLEHFVLTMPESREEDECSMPAKLKEEAEVAKGMFRFNSRRGRQLRDFQKDILPGLVSLSRHEICEDMHAFTEIAKLDELGKKGMTGNASRGNRNTTVRSRRPRRR